MDIVLNVAFSLKHFCCKDERFLLTAEKSAIFVCQCTIIRVRVYFTRNPYVCTFMHNYGCVFPRVCIAIRVERRGFRTLVIFCYMANMHVHNNPLLSLQPGFLGILLGLKCGMVRDCAREVNLAQVSRVMMFVFVALPTLVGVWLMALVLRQLIEYYY